MTASIEEFKNLVINGQFEDLSTQLPEDDAERLQALQDIEASLQNGQSILMLACDTDYKLLPQALSVYPESARLEAISKVARAIPGLPPARTSSSPEKPWLNLLTDAYHIRPTGDLLDVIQAVLSSLPNDARVTALTQANYYRGHYPLDIAVKHPELWAVCMDALPEGTLQTAVDVRNTYCNTFGLSLLHRIALDDNHEAMSLVLGSLPPEQRLRTILRYDHFDATSHTVDLSLRKPTLLSVIFNALSVTDRLGVAASYYKREKIPAPLFAAITAGLSHDDALRLVTSPIHFTAEIVIRRYMSAAIGRDDIHTTILYEAAKSRSDLSALLNALKSEPSPEEDNAQTTNSDVPDFLRALNEQLTASRGQPMEKHNTMTRLFALLSAAKTILLDSPQTVDKQTFATLSLSAINTTRPILEHWGARKWGPLLDKLAADITALARVTAGHSVFDEADGDGPVAPPEDAVVAAAV